MKAGWAWSTKPGIPAGRLVAIKVLPSEANTTPDGKRRFVREAKAASALNHPNIITIYGIDHAADVDFIAMEYVTGTPLISYSHCGASAGDGVAVRGAGGRCAGRRPMPPASCIVI